MTIKLLVVMDKKDVKDFLARTLFSNLYFTVEL